MEIISYSDKGRKSASRPLTPIKTNYKVSGLSHINVAREVTFTDGALETYMYSSFEYPNPQNISMPTFRELQTTKNFSLPFPDTDIIKGSFKGWILSPKTRNPIIIAEESTYKVIGGEKFIAEYTYTIPTTIQINGLDVDQLTYNLAVDGREICPFDKTAIKKLALECGVILNNYKSIQIIFNNTRVYNTLTNKIIPFTLQEIPESLIINFMDEPSSEFYWWADEKNHDIYVGSCTEVLPKPQQAYQDPQSPTDMLEYAYIIDEWERCHHLYICDEMYPRSVAGMFQQVEDIIGFEKLHYNNFQNCFSMFALCYAFENKDLILDWDMELCGGETTFKYCNMFTTCPSKSIIMPYAKTSGEDDDNELMYMFAMCDNLQHIYVGSNWQLIPTTKENGIFAESSNLHNWTTAKSITNEYAIIDDGVNGGILEPANLYYLIDGDEIFFGYEMPEGRGTPQVYNDVAGSPPWADNDSIKKFTITTRVAIKHPDNFFYGLKRLEDIVNLDKLTLSNATSTFRMFNNCYRLYEADVSSFDMSNITNAQAMFYNCHNLKEIDVSSWKFNKPVNCALMFAGVGTGVDRDGLPIYSLDFSGFNTSNVFAMTGILANTGDSDEVSTIDITGWDFSNVQDISYFVGNRSSLKQLIYDQPALNFESSADLTAAFSGSGLESINVNAPNTRIFADFASNTKSLKTVVLNGVLGSNIENTENMFAKSGVETITVESTSNWGNITNSNNMFDNCVNLHNWRQENPTDKTYAIIDNGINGGYFMII